MGKISDLPTLVKQLVRNALSTELLKPQFPALHHLRLIRKRTFAPAWFVSTPRTQHQPQRSVGRAQISNTFLYHSHFLEGSPRIRLRKFCTSTLHPTPPNELARLQLLRTQYLRTPSPHPISQHTQSMSIGWPTTPSPSTHPVSHKDAYRSRSDAHAQRARVLPPSHTIKR
jgi:hypothetical protein